MTLRRARPIPMLMTFAVASILAAGCGSSSSSGSSTTSTAANATTVPDGRLGGVYGTAQQGNYKGKDGVHSVSFTVSGNKITNLITDEYARFGSSVNMIGDDGFEAFSADKKWQVYGSVLKNNTSWVVTLKYLPAPDNKNINWQMGAELVK